MSPVARDRGVFVGMMGLEDDARVDFARLRAERRAKVLSGMESHDLDALMLGGVGNVRYVSGARQLGRSGVLPFAPVAVVVRDTGTRASAFDVGRGCAAGDRPRRSVPHELESGQPGGRPGEDPRLARSAAGRHRRLDADVRRADSAAGHARQTWSMPRL